MSRRSRTTQSVDPNRPRFGQLRPRKPGAVWPGKPQDAEGETQAEHPWNPTGFGPGMGPDLSEPFSEPDDSTDVRPVHEQYYESCTISEAADEIVRYKVGEECPNCGFAKLKLDADRHVSCPICGFGAYRACG